MLELYNSNARFKEYVDRYCFKHNITVEVALSHELVRSAYEFYNGATRRSDKDSRYSAKAIDTMIAESMILTGRP